MEKIWLKSYPPGIPKEINPDAYQSLVELLEQSCEQNRDSAAFYNLGVVLTYHQLDHYTRDFAAYLQQELKLPKNTRIAIMLPNSLQYPVAMFGALRAGMIVVNVNPLYKADELSFQLNNSEAEVLVGLANFADIIAQALPHASSVKYVIITQFGDLFPPLRAWLTNFVLKYIHKKIPSVHIPQTLDFKKVLAQGKKLILAPILIKNQDIAFLQYTGGTTGISKGATLTHRNLIANIEQADAWFKNLLSTHKEGQEVIITALPLYHVFSLTANCLFFTKIGGLNVLISDPRDIPGMIKEMRKFKFTAITGVNTLFNALIKNPNFAKLDFKHLRLALGGGMSVQRAVAEKWQAITLRPLLEAYGLTETSPCVAINPANLKAYNGTVGLPVPSTDICILDDDRKELGIGVAGELAIKGPQVMKSYWQNSSETAKVFTEDGWLLTGDIASIDEQGFVRILERKKDMILVSGFNVYPNEIEDVIARMSSVREVVVVGIPDENSGETVKAFIVKDDPQLTVGSVIEFCREHLTPYKVPKKIEFCAELPKTYVGKILRRALRGTQ